ncbi:hypothetical protein V6615_13495 [Oscillospiraceae bacterium PP1C4]
MVVQSNIFIRLVFIPIAIGVCALLIVLSQERKKDPSLLSYVIGYGICVSINVLVLIVTMGFLLLPCYIITFGPLMIFSFKLNKKLIKGAGPHNTFISFICKILIPLLIWFMAFFPFSLWAIKEIIDIPAKNAVQQEVAQFQEEILNSKTYVDLTQFGLGIYKLQNEGDIYLWDITKPTDYVTNFEGVYQVYESHFNRKDEANWDNAWGNSNQGKDILYDVYFYDDTYIIVTPLREKPVNSYYWGYIYLCKDIKKNVDLFDVGILDPEVVEKLRELPGEKLSRKELSEKLGKTA